MPIKTLAKLNLLLFFTIISCSKGDSGEKTIDFDENAQLQVSGITATSAIFQLQSGFNDNLKVRVRRKSATNYTFIEIGTTYNELEPGSIYEAQLFVDETEENSSPYDTIIFATPLLDFFSEFNSENFGQYIKSIPGFEHELELATLTENYTGIFNSDFKLELINALDENIKWNIEYAINGNILKFVMPIDILDNTTSNLDNFYLRYNFNDISYYITQSLSKSKYIFTVFQPEPSFTSMGTITKELCDGVSAFNIHFFGYFFNSLDGPGYGEVIYDNVNLILTNLDDGTELLIDNENKDASFNTCDGFKRYRTADSILTVGNLLQIHSNVILTLKYTETLDGPFIFTSGNYKIKANFTNDEGDIKTTNEFEFIIP